jgi:hypothetical protein
MSFLPKYQWLTENGNTACGIGCDVVQIDADTDKKFQVSFTPTVLLDENFDGNNIAFPMEKIFVGLGSFGSGSGTGEYYGITFDLDLTNDNHFINSFSFVFEGQSYCYIFQALSDVLLINYTTVEYGGFTLVKLSTYFGSLMNPYDSYVYAFNEIMNPYGIFAIQNGTPSITVYGFPENTQVTTGDIYYNNIITDGVGVDTFGLSNFLPYNNQVCYFNIAALNQVQGATCTPTVGTRAINIDANKRLIFTVSYSNNLSFDNVKMDLNIINASLVQIDVITKDVYSGNNTISFVYETTYSGVHYFDFEINDISCGFFDEYYGFCFTLIKIESIARLSSINVQGCTTANVPFSEEYNDLYNSLITMNTGSLPNGLITTGKWILTLTDDENNTVTSITYETIDGTTCLTRNLMRLVWSSNCMFANLDYKNLPFTNDVYVKGYYISQPIDNKERVINTLSSGELEMIYNYSLEKKEFSIGIYTEIFYRTLQRAFEHKTISINGVSYKQDTDSVLIKKPEGYKYSARIELVEVGSSVVSTACCC